MKLPQIFLFATLTLLPLPSFAAIFGADDRLPLPPGSPHYEASRATALAILSANFEPAGEGKIKIDPGKLDELCEGEKFRGEPSMSYACTGFLVGPDLIATAGHCMVNTGESRNEPGMYCEAYSWLFDYRNEADGSVRVKDVPADRLYKCKEVIYAVKDEQAPFRDYALVRLDRPVLDRKPYTLSTAPVNMATQFHMYGHPLGLPLKHSRFAMLLKNDFERESFLTSLDAFEGNSGSPVFTQKGEIAGILVGGTPSISTVEQPGHCSKLNRCAENGTNCLLPDQNTGPFNGYQGVGSEVQRIAPIVELIQSLPK